MTMRKILSVLLCVCAVLSVMAVVASALDLDPPPPDTPTTAPAETTTKKPLGDQISDAWAKIKVWFEPLYRFSFQGLSQALVTAFQWLLRLVGIGTWTLPWA